MKKPPKAVKMVMEAVCIMMGIKPEKVSGVALKPSYSMALQPLWLPAGRQSADAFGVHVSHQAS